VIGMVTWEERCSGHWTRRPADLGWGGVLPVWRIFAGAEFKPLPAGAERGGEYDAAEDEPEPSCWWTGGGTARVGRGSARVECERG
jgi:hypothetical protein